MKKIFILTDYKGYFGSKITALPYRSGMDKHLLNKYFNSYGYSIEYISFSDIEFREKQFSGDYILYTTTEDFNLHYKDYIEDIIFGLSLTGAILIPQYKYLRAVANKVLMEILRDQFKNKKDINIESYHFGTLEELKKKLPELDFITPERRLNTVVFPAPFGPINPTNSPCSRVKL